MKDRVPEGASDPQRRQEDRIVNAGSGAKEEKIGSEGTSGLEAFTGGLNMTLAHDSVILERLLKLAESSPLVPILQQKVFARDSEYLQSLPEGFSGDQRGLTYHLFIPANENATPDELFSSLRWGGRVIFFSDNEKAVRGLAQRYSRWAGFLIDVPVTRVRNTPFGLPLPWSKTVYYFVARKVDLIKPGQSSDRFTYHVQLAKRHAEDENYLVVKRVPTIDRVMARLQERFPDASLDDIRRRAGKFTEKIFPVFLTREAAMLKILERDLPEHYKNRVPQCLGVEHDSRGFVRTLYMNWMRNGGDGLSHLDFCSQAAELLSVMHDKIGVIHLDLRLDNFVVTERGVGFIDFGSAVRVGEKFADNSLLSTLFEEMMRTSQIQRMLGQMKEQGLVTSRVLSDGHHKVDKAVDLFYLAVQFNKPHGNPDFRGLVRFGPRTLEARLIKRLTESILRPVDGASAPYRSAADIFKGLQQVREDVRAGREEAQYGPTLPQRNQPRVADQEASGDVEALAALVP